MRPGPPAALAVLLLLGLYVGVWTFRRPLGLVQPAANLAYICYPGPLELQRAFHILFRPCARITGERHFSFDRAPETSGP